MAEPLISNDEVIIANVETVKVVDILKKGYSEKRTPYNFMNTYKAFKLEKIGGVDRVVKKSDGKLFVTKNDAHNIIQAIHEELDHECEISTIYNRLQETYGNIPLRIVNNCVKRCVGCLEIRRKRYESLFNSSFDVKNRGHISVVPMPLDGKYTCILHYLLVKSKFSVLRPLISDSAHDVAQALLDIMLHFGSPHVLQSNSRRITTEVIRSLKSIWPEFTFINGKYEEDHTKYSIAVKLKISDWMTTNESDQWSGALPIIQWEMNTTINEGFNVTPFEMVFNRTPSLGIAPVRCSPEIKAQIMNFMVHEEEINRSPDTVILNFNNSPNHNDILQSDRLFTKKPVQQKSVLIQRPLAPSKNKPPENTILLLQTVDSSSNFECKEKQSNQNLVNVATSVNSSSTVQNKLPEKSLLSNNIPKVPEKSNQPVKIITPAKRSLDPNEDQLINPKIVLVVDSNSSMKTMHPFRGIKPRTTETAATPLKTQTPAHSDTPVCKKTIKTYEKGNLNKTVQITRKECRELIDVNVDSAGTKSPSKLITVPPKSLLVYKCIKPQSKDYTIVTVKTANPSSNSELSFVSDISSNVAAECQISNELQIMKSFTLATGGD